MRGLLHFFFLIFGGGRNINSKQQNRCIFASQSSALWEEQRQRTKQEKSSRKIEAAGCAEKHCLCHSAKVKKSQNPHRNTGMKNDSISSRLMPDKIAVNISWLQAKYCLSTISHDVDSYNEKCGTVFGERKINFFHQHGNF